jgi:hypothetical protein
VIRSAAPPRATRTTYVLLDNVRTRGVGGQRTNRLPGSAAPADDYALPPGTNMTSNDGDVTIDHGRNSSTRRGC